MIAPILKIKTVVPPIEKNLISRNDVKFRLNNHLFENEGFARQLTLFSAPAGYGKTTVVRDWIESTDFKTAWFSIDESDNDAARFWSYLISAVNSVNTQIGKGTLAILRASDNSPTSKMGTDFLIPLLNDLYMSSDPVMMILDDYHIIHNQDIHEQLIYLIENMPPSFHLVVTTRSDPPWPLSRWRSQNTMIDIRLNTLALSEQEADSLFTSFNMTHLNAQQKNALYAKTEGWITGLKLAILSITDDSNPDLFINNFTDSHRHIVRFLIDEVFSKQSEKVKSFLIHTSILNRFNADLCNAVTECDDGDEMIAKLERINLFVIPLDHQGIWHRYHPLFSDVLRVKLRKTYQGDIKELYKRASQWLLNQGTPGEAARLLLTGKLEEDAVRIFHDYYDDMLHSEGTSYLYQSLSQIPESVILKYPRLMAHMALFHLIHQGLSEAKRYIQLADKLRYENKQEQTEYEGILSATKAYMHIFDHNFPEALKQAGIAAYKISNDNFYWHMNTAIYMGDAELFSGNPIEALNHYRTAQMYSQKIGNLVLLMNTGFKSAYSNYLLGNLSTSESVVRNLLEQAKTSGLSTTPRAGLLWVLLGEIMRENGSYQQAMKANQRGMLYSEPEKPCLGWNYLFEADLFITRKDYAAAMMVIDKIRLLHLDVTLPSFIMLPAACKKAKILLANGDFKTAIDCLSSEGIYETASIQPAYAYGYLILAEALFRLRLSQNNKELCVVSNILDTVKEQAQAGGQKALYLEAGLLQAMVAEADHQKGKAMRYLAESCLSGAESGYRQLFLDRADELCQIAERLLQTKMNDQIKSRLSVDLVRLIAGHLSGDTDDAISQIQAANPPQIHADRLADNLVEHLSKRELEILNLISQGLSNQSISDKLYLSLGTVKWHTSNIYGKLGVRGRTQAVAEARQIGLIR